MRVAAAIAAVQTHTHQPVQRLIRHVARVAQPVDVQGFRHDLGQRHHRVQRRIAVLKHHLHLAAKRLQRLVVQPGDVNAVDQNLPRRRLHQPQGHQAGGAFARPAFAHQPQNPVARQDQRDIPHRLQGLGRGKAVSPAQGVGFGQVAKFQRVFGHTTLQQATSRPGAVLRSNGISSAHCGKAIGQRG